MMGPARFAGSLPLSTPTPPPPKPRRDGGGGLRRTSEWLTRAVPPRPSHTVGWRDPPDPTAPPSGWRNGVGVDGRGLPASMSVRSLVPRSAPLLSNHLWDPRPGWRRHAAACRLAGGDTPAPVRGEAPRGACAALVGSWAPPGCGGQGVGDDMDGMMGERGGGGPALPTWAYMSRRRRLAVADEARTVGRQRSPAATRLRTAVTGVFLFERPSHYRAHSSR